MKEAAFIGEVASRLGCDAERAEGLTFAVFHELRDRLPAKESADVAAQLPTGLKHLWRDSERPRGAMERVHEAEFIGRIRNFAGLGDDREAERAVRAVFATLQKALGSADGTQGEAWDVFSVLPKDLKRLWLTADAPAAH